MVIKNRFMDREKPLLLSRTQDFFGVKAPDSIPDWCFDVGVAADRLHLDLKNAVDMYGGLSDYPPEDQVEAIVQAYTRFRDSIGAEADKYKNQLKGCQLENGRLKKKIEKLEAGK